MMNFFESIYFPIVILFFVGIVILCVVCKHLKDKEDKKVDRIIPSVALIVLTIIIGLLNYECPAIIYRYPKPVSFILGLATTLALSSLTGILLVRAAGEEKKVVPTYGVEVLKGLADHPKSGGYYIGLLESALFFVAMIFNPTYIGGLLTFKVAAKWEAWKNVVQLPQTLPGIELEYIVFRRKWSSWLLTRFLVGTFSHILFSAMGYGVYKWILIILDPPSFMRLVS